ncbi:hypothetical protein JOF41_005965 [Saccharothrix coeruleofusca]|uniref:SdrD B-like domain-containing protein n=1 Tax=Saccharothrix coeruleofusca TaxID=33919 RepID=UPI001AE4BBB6|nr:SdrD B-like domain-containing protein [Saccharothrix coeruleofusca]MBP2339787.1 hypothetical protein [Saccharothrix coeruleofusca]
MTSAAVAQEDQPKALKKISGMVWQDQNANGRIDAGEPGIAGHEMVLVGPSGRQTRLSGADGRYSFDNLPDGIYHLRSTDRSAFGQDRAPSPSYMPSGELTSPIELSDQADPSGLSFDSGFLAAAAKAPTSQVASVSTPAATGTSTSAPAVASASTSAPATTTATTTAAPVAQQDQSSFGTGALVGLLALVGVVLAGAAAAVWRVRLGK